MTFPATAEVDEFDEAIAWFQARFPLTAEILGTLGEYAGARAWTIAAVTQLDAVLTAHSIISNALELGTPLREVVKELGTALADYGFSGARLETIALTNLQSAYSAGRYQQLSDPDLMAIRPYRQVDGIGDHRQTPYCRSIDGVTLPADDPRWESMWPPFHHRCRTTIRSLSEREYAKVPEEKRSLPISVEQPSDGFGLAPSLETAWGPTAGKYPSALWDEYEAKRAAAITKSLRGYTDEEEGWLREASFAEFLHHGELQYMRTGMRKDSIDYARAQLIGDNPTLLALRREPIIVNHWHDGVNSLGDGRHRLFAAQEAGATAIRVTERTYGPRGGLREERTRVMRIDHTVPVAVAPEDETGT